VAGTWHPDDVPTGDAAQTAPTPGSVPALTEREVDVLRYLPTRLSTSDIATRLHISPNTVKTHLKHLYRKLGARSRNQAIAHAVEAHLLAGQSNTLPAGYETTPEAALN
jgi:DNA-binding CsgD family transcriptional regulator